MTHIEPSTSCCPFNPPYRCIVNLQLIDCSGQGLTSVPSRIHDCVADYKYISFRGNDLRCPDLEYVDGFKVDLGHNPLNCSCLQIPSGNVQTASSSLKLATSPILLPSTAHVTVLSTSVNFLLTTMPTSATSFSSISVNNSTSSTAAYSKKSFTETKRSNGAKRELNG